jgi:glycosyltransferase involved in cell wall biosynthesis
LTILFVNMSIDMVTGGGTATRTMSVMHAVQDDFDVDCNVLATSQGLSNELINKNKNSSVVLLPCLNDRFYIPYFSFSQMKKLINKVDMIHLMSHWTVINIIVYFFARRYGKPYTFCPAGTLKVFGRSSIIKRMYNYIIGDRIIKNASKCIAITELEKRDFEEFDVDDSKIIVIPNGISIHDFFPNSAAADSFNKKFMLEGVHYALFMGRLNEIKGPDLLLKAFSRLATEFEKLHIVFAGPDEGLKRSLMTETHKHSLENRVHIIDYIGGSDKVGAYTGSALLIVPSRREAMSIVALEAGACGTPVLLTSECGFDEVSEVGCEVVPPSVDGLYEGMRRMLQSNNLDSIGYDLRDKIINKYTWKHTAEAYLKILK